MAAGLLAGTTVYWTSNGATLQGTIVSTNLLNANGSEFAGGGEPFYSVKSVTGSSAPASSSAIVLVRQAEARANP